MILDRLISTRATAKSVSSSTPSSYPITLRPRTVESHRGRDLVQRDAWLLAEDAFKLLQQRLRTERQRSRAPQSEDEHCSTDGQQPPHLPTVLPASSSPTISRCSSALENKYVHRPQKSENIALVSEGCRK